MGIVRCSLGRLDRLLGRGLGFELIRLLVSADLSKALCRLIQNGARVRTQRAGGLDQVSGLVEVSRLVGLPDLPPCGHGGRSGQFRALLPKPSHELWGIVHNEALKKRSPIEREGVLVAAHANGPTVRPEVRRHAVGRQEQFSVLGFFDDPRSTKGSEGSEDFVEGLVGRLWRECWPQQISKVLPGVVSPAWIGGEVRQEGQGLFSSGRMKI